MRHKRYQIWFLVGYLGLLLNLGESLHHAEIFGHHANGFGSACCHCCCGHTTTEDSEQDVPSVSPDHDCAFCKFFAQYHVTTSQVELPEQVNSTMFRCWNKPNEMHAVILVPLARGPPAVA